MSSGVDAKKFAHRLRYNLYGEIPSCEEPVRLIVIDLGIYGPARPLDLATRSSWLIGGELESWECEGEES